MGCETTIFFHFRYHITPSIMLFTAPIYNSCCILKYCTFFMKIYPMLLSRIGNIERNIVIMSPAHLFWIYFDGVYNFSSIHNYLCMFMGCFLQSNFISGFWFFLYFALVQIHMSLLRCNNFQYLIIIRVYCRLVMERV